MKLLQKLFLSFFITNICLAGLIIGLISLNFSSGFNEFIVNSENQQIAKIKQQLIELYQRHNNSWQPIIDDDRNWRNIVDPKAPPPPPRGGRKERPPEHHVFTPPSVNQDDASSSFIVGRLLSLYDPDKQIIIGKKRYLDENSYTEVIKLNNEVIGWLGYQRFKIKEDSPAAQFLKQQYKNYIYIAAAAILIALVMATLLARHLIGPVKSIIDGTNSLIQGNYSKQIKRVTNDELGTLSDNFNDLANTLEQSQKNRAQWISDTSHELRTPLTVLQTQLQAIQDGIFVADNDRIQLFISQIENLSRIVDDLYQLSNSDAGGLNYEKFPLDPIEVLNQAVKNFKVKFEQKQLTLDNQTLDFLGKCEITADKNRLLQLFTNLLENTCRYTNDEGTIRLQANISGPQLEIILMDSPPSVSKEEHNMLFERFYRVEKSRNRARGGSGLGLSICKSIVEAHHGNIIAMDSSLGGLGIKITFPINLNRK